MNPQIAQMTPIEAAAMFVRGELAECAIYPVATAPGSVTRECSICESAKSARTFRSVIGRITTEACGECCDLRDEVSGAARDPFSRTAIAEFCLRVAMKRARRFLPQESSSPNGRGIKGEGASAAAVTPHPVPLPMGEGANAPKEKSALAKDPKEYAAKLQRLPDRVAAVLAKTVAWQGDGFELDDATALVMLTDLITDLDPSLMERNANKKLARFRQPS